MSGCSVKWFAGLTCDHLYANCPNRTRAEAELRRARWWEVGSDWNQWESLVDPHGTDICGMCLHRHNRSEHKGVAA